MFGLLELCRPSQLRSSTSSTFKTSKWTSCSSRSAGGTTEHESSRLRRRARVSATPILVGPRSPDPAAPLLPLASPCNSFSLSLSPSLRTPSPYSRTYSYLRAEAARRQPQPRTTQQSSETALGLLWQHYLTWIPPIFVGYPCAAPRTLDRVQERLVFTVVLLLRPRLVPDEFRSAAPGPLVTPRTPPSTSHFRVDLYGYLALQVHQQCCSTYQCECNCLARHPCSLGDTTP
ncbi:hypothetical protein C8Q79DRAFT_687075 [Trametes meyenii]|nr:hypothetical protein C8Q79DRAFT_687075 [Trametes meyenii]